MMDIFEKLNQQAIIIKKQAFKSLKNRLFLACQQYKTDSEWAEFFDELLLNESYHDITNAIQLLKVSQVYKDKLQHILNVSQFYHVQTAENADHKTLTQFKVTL
ncbi:hypothetical protein NYR30_06890 [Gallibacterium salpingitidis]|uniref:hypothetical protein n=1 Tax=Gallibacterium salpingitidis TaxID=505341 RepID=UPI0026707C69|nr:hypothetical protein [Gallibacterium salpingitidis]WKS98515.1 hypothetical protein NYR30_06890 [Gallibacterium salpingitidis]